MTSHRILVVGELLWDEFGNSRNPAGAPYNFARQARSLGLDPVLISAVGRDDDGAALEAHVHQSGVCAMIQKNDYPTGVARVVSQNGQNQFELLMPSAWDFIEWNEDIQATLDQCSAVYFGSLAMRSARSRDTIRKISAHQNCVRFCDINLRSPFDDDDAIQWCLEHCDVLKISDQETPRLARIWGCSVDEVCRLCLELTGIKLVVETLGDQGARAFHRNGLHAFAPADPVHAVSTVGAGDAFFAAFAASYFAHESLRDMLVHANQHVHGYLMPV